MRNPLQAVREMFRPRAGYDATETKGRRADTGHTIKSEDLELPGTKRRRLIKSAHDLRRNFSIAAWALRKHLDYVADFRFQCKTGDDRIDDRVEELMTWWARAANCDTAGRHSLPRLIRLAESHRTLDGDVGVLKLSSGALQLIEGDRVRDPGADEIRRLGIAPESVTHGIETDPDGYARAYMVHKRTQTGGYVFERSIPARNMIWHGYYDRADQVRGVSPLAAAINSYRDVYEGMDYALARAKVAQMFGLVLYRDAADAAGVVSEQSATADGGNSGKKYDIDFGRGPVLLDLDPGDKAEFLDNSTPSTEFQTYMQNVIRVALLSLDIPYSLFDVSETTYSGGRMDWIQYDQSARAKRAENVELLNRLTAWRLNMFLLDGTLQLPEGVRVADLKWDWIPTGLPWLDPLKEVEADTLAIKGALDNPEDICRRHGTDVYDHIDKTARVLAYARDKGVPVEWATSAARTITDPGDSTNA